MTPDENLRSPYPQTTDALGRTWELRPHGWVCQGRDAKPQELELQTRPPHPHRDLKTAIQLAVEAHDGQVDDHGLPYILHPFQVMIDVASVTPEPVRPAAMIVAVLHDTLEDTTLTQRDIDSRFGGDISELVWVLTRYPGQRYEQFIERVNRYPVARIVKTCDVLHNLRRGATSDAETDARRRRKYLKALTMLKGSDDWSD